MALNEEILSALEKVAQSGEFVRLINEFKGLPIVHPASLLEVTPDGLQVIVHPQQAVCLQLEKFTFIQSEMLPFILRASVVSVDMANCIVNLSNILYGSDTVGGRTQIRVQPALPVMVTVAGRSRILRGELADLSLVGVGMYALSAYMYNPVTLKRGTDVQVQVTLSEDESLTLPGMILYATPEGDTYRLGVRTQPDDAARTRLAEFIGARRLEIEDELSALYIELSHH